LLILRVGLAVVLSGVAAAIGLALPGRVDLALGLLARGELAIERLGAPSDGRPTIARAWCATPNVARCFSTR
jgi:hypothetical protein